MYLLSLLVLLLVFKNGNGEEQHNRFTRLGYGPKFYEKGFGTSTSSISGAPLSSNQPVMESSIVQSLSLNDPPQFRFKRSNEEVPEELVQKYLQIHPSMTKDQAKQAVALALMITNNYAKPKPTERPKSLETCQVVNMASNKKPSNRESLETLMEKGSEQLILNKNKEVILIMGNTGSGKTTLTQILAGDLTNLHAVETTAGQMVIIDNENRIGLPSTKSKTLIPELIISANSSLAFYDCPGFSDSRGAEVDIAATYFTKKVTDHVNKVKLLFLVLSSSVQLGNDRLDFDLLVKHAVKFVKNLNKYKHAIALVVTKVNNYSHERGTYLTDEQIMNRIAEFLIQYRSLQKTIETTSGISNEEKESVKKRIQFLDILLETDSKGNYTRIGFSRTPDKCGVLSEIDVVASSKVKLTKIYKRLDYVTKANIDFGYTLKPESELKVIEIVSDMNKEIETVTNGTVSNFLISHNNKAKKQKTSSLSSFSSQAVYECNMISQLVTDLKNISNPLKFANEISNSFLQMNFTVSKNFIKSLERRGDYFSFFETVTEKKVERKNNLWTGPVKTLKEYLCSLSEWYTFLVNLQGKLGEYNVQNKKELKVEYQSSENDLQFVNSSLLPVDHEIFNKIFESSRGSAEQFRLKKLLEFSLQSPKVDCIRTGKENKLIVSGNYILVSDFIHGGSVRSEDCRNCKIIQVTASDTLFIDESINGMGKEMQVSFIAPKWEIIGEQLINLDGQKGRSFSTSKYFGNGDPGGPGGNGGLFFGIGDKFINGNKLTVRANGGDGGQGQAGADGDEGQRGVDMTYEKFPSCLSRQCPNREKNVFLVVYNHDSCTIEGSPGTPGENGMHGGAGGIGGNEGNLYLIGESEINLRAYPGSLGQDGAGGLGGRGGQSGNSLTCYRWDVIYYASCGYTAKDCDSSPSVAVARSGTHGRAGINRNAMQEPSFKNYDLSYSKYLNYFKTVVIANEYPSGIGKQFLDKLETNRKVIELYDTAGFLDELLNLQNDFHSLKNKINLVPYYESFLNRLEVYAKAPKSSETDLTFRKFRNYLYASALSTICALRQTPGSALVTDTTGYFSGVKRTIEKLKQAVPKNVTLENSQKYTTELQKQILESLDFIRLTILPAIDQVSEGINEHVEDILASDFKTEPKTKFQAVRKLKTLFFGLKAIDKITSFLGVKGAMIWFIVGSEAMIAEPFRLEDNSKLKSKMNPPTIMQDTFAIIQNRVEAEEQMRIQEINAKIDIIDNLIRNRTEVPEFKTLKDKVDAARVALGESTQSNSGRVSDEYFWVPKKLEEIYRNLDQSIMEAIAELENTHSNRIDTGDGHNDPLIDLRTAHKATQLIEIGLNASFNVVSDTAELFEIADELIDTDSKETPLRKYEEDIYNRFLPLVQKMDFDLDSVTIFYNNSLRSGLRVGEWKVDETLFDIKRTIKELTEEHTFSEDFQHLTEKLDEGLSTLIDLYDNIEKYEENKRLSDYIGNIYSTESQSIELFKTGVNPLITIQSIMPTLFLSEYENAVHTFKQWVFPFARIYLKEFDLPSNLSSLWSGMSLANFYRSKIDTLELKVDEYKNRIVGSEEDSHILHTRFTSGWQFSNPFYIWKKEKWGDSIRDILSGKKVQMKADVAESDGFKGAIKFQRIEIHLKHRNPDMQAEVDELLKNYRVSMTHIGTSYYRFQGEYFVMHGDSQVIQYNFEKDGDNRLGSNTAYGKFRNGDFLMSPYTLWTFQISKKNQHETKVDFSDLEGISHLVDLELVGTGTYVDERIKGLPNLELEKFYQIDDSIFKDGRVVDMEGVSENGFSIK